MIGCNNGKGIKNGKAKTKIKIERRWSPNIEVSL